MEEDEDVDELVEVTVDSGAAKSVWPRRKGWGKTDENCRNETKTGSGNSESDRGGIGVRTP